VWDQLAHCESTGNWAANTGNGFSGGLQFTASTWAAYGGGQYAAQAHLATKDQQISVAARVAAGQGWHAWPACSKKLGLSGKGASAPAAVNVAARQAAPRAPAAPVTKMAPMTKPATPAPAPSSDVWTNLAQCSSNGNWTIHPGNGVSGGLAIKTATWTLFGGRQYAPQPYQATKDQQLSVGEKIVAGQGWKAWPKCAAQLGLTGVGAPTPQSAPAPKQTPSASKTPPAPKKQSKSGTAVPSAHSQAAPHTAALSANVTGSGVTVTLPNGKTVTAPNPTAATAVRAALSQLGVPYAYGAARPGKLLDCSALVQYAYRQAGVALGRSSRTQAVGARISQNNLMAGDLVVWSGHVAMYLGNGQMLETGATVVKIVPFRTTNIGMRFLGFYRPTP
jgi:cell wall-associated NlpC family hydrolase